MRHIYFKRPDIVVDIEKLQMLLDFKAQGAHLVVGSFSDQQSLVNAVKLVDAVICAISGVHIRSHQILLQLKLVDAIKEAGNVKRFFPSEFGTDPATMSNAMEHGRITFDDKMVVRRAIEEAGIPFTYVSANCFAGYFLGGLCQPGHIIPSRDSVTLLGDGNQKASYVDEDDIAMYTIKTIDDPRTLNKTLYTRPPKNIVTKRSCGDMGETDRKRAAEIRNFQGRVSSFHERRRLCRASWVDTLLSCVLRGMSYKF
ncbi:hypothetical protein Tsubulata_001455 [Turnera subulata]|uniref:(+)-lariciresinol reductase n=1 Tax=Turnera subulata TaxID=218843 RepID=A0A9Q0FEU7_9ROSI|nr:hypothetical protein Tsubulata_001455 [Turnera subulata]